RLDDLERLTASLDPVNVLRRGFAVVRDAEGRTIRDAARAAPGSAIVAELAHGRLHARVERVERGARDALGANGANGASDGAR
ncbi:hypothetical protein NL533_34065, partial [Klebsiella pneumoniae]|nr:hypothetical protein [Klebsiella pneumoniae]